MRKNKIEYYLNIAKMVASRSPCSRRKFGTVIVKDDTIVATGYNGTIRGALNCGEEVPCLKDMFNEPAYQSYDMCPAVHAEENACYIAGKERGTGATLYLAPSLGVGDRPCFRCRRAIWQIGIETVIYVDREGNIAIDKAQDYVNMENEWIMEKLEKGNPKYAEEKLHE